MKNRWTIASLQKTVVDRKIPTCAVMGKQNNIGRQTTIGKFLVTGDKVTIGSNVTIGNTVAIGQGSTIHDGVVLGNGVAIGAAVTIPSNMDIPKGISIYNGIDMTGAIIWDMHDHVEVKGIPKKYPLHFYQVTELDNLVTIVQMGMVTADLTEWQGRLSTMDDFSGVTNQAREEVIEVIIKMTTEED